MKRVSRVKVKRRKEKKGLTRTRTLQGALFIFSRRILRSLKIVISRNRDE